MRYSYQWLKELSGTKKSPQELAEFLTMRAFEVESVEKVGFDADFLLDIKVLPDRAHDCLSHVGMAREIAALEHGKLDYDYDGLKLPRQKTRAFTASIAVPDKCRRHIGVLMQGVSVGDSPVWLKQRLELLGIRSINNIVDVTNYVMLELGQPLHAFDWDTLATREGKVDMSVRWAQPGKKITLLDGKEHVLDERDLVIADHEKAVDLAGVMGSAATAISEKTKNIFLEAANFDAATIRRSRLRHGLRTDASDRFEKNLDSSLAEKAMARLLELLQHTVGGNIEGVSDVCPQPANNASHNKAGRPVKPGTILLETKAVETLLGIPVPAKKITDALGRIGCTVKKAKNGWSVNVPAWRVDLESPEDLIEEIGKAVGYESIPSVSPLVSLQAALLPLEKRLERRIQDACATSGMTEVYNYSFYSEQDARACGLERAPHLELENPMNPEQALMRTSLLPGLLKNARSNLKYFETLALFEMGHIYQLLKAEVDERNTWAGLMVGGGEGGHDFYILKGWFEKILKGLDVTPEFETADKTEQYWHPTRTADILIRDNSGTVRVGRMGEVHPLVRDAFKIKKPVQAFVIDMESLSKYALQKKQFVTVRKFPLVLRDLSLFIPTGVRVKDVLDILRATGGEILVEVALFDQYFDETAGKESMAFHLSFGDHDQTLSSEKVDGILRHIIAALEGKMDVQVRR